MEVSRHDNLVLGTFFYSMHKCFSLSVDFQHNQNVEFLEKFESFYLRNSYLKAEGSSIFKIILSDDLDTPIIVYLEPNNLFLMNEPIITLKNKSISLDYKSFFQLPTNEDFEFCLGQFNDETPPRQLLERVQQALSTFTLDQSVSPEFPIFEKNWNKTLFSFDERSLDDLEPLRMLYEPLMAIDLENTSQCVLDYITNLREISLTEGDNFIQVRHNAPDFVYSRIFKYSPSEILLAYGNVLSLWFGISFDSFISISFRLYEDLRTFCRHVLSERRAG